MDQYDLTKLAIDAVAPVAEALESPAAEQALLRELGFVLPDGVTLLSGIGPALEALVDAAVELADLDASADATELIELFGEITAALGTIVESIAEFADGLSTASKNSPFVTGSDVLQVLPGRLVDYLLATFVQRHYPAVHQALVLTGVLDESDSDPQDQPHRAPFTERRFQWDQLPLVLSDPIGQLTKRYDWDAASMDADLLIRDARALGAAVGLRAELQAIDQRAKAAFDLALAGAGTVPGDAETTVARVPLLPMVRSPLGVEVYPVKGGGGNVDGLGFGVYIDPSADVKVQISDSLRSELSVSGFASGFGLVLLRGEEPKLVSALFGPTPASVLATTAVDVRLRLIYESADGAPVVLAGTPAATHLEVGTIGVTVGVAKPASGDADLSVEAALAKGALVVRAAEGDGFLGDVLGEGFVARFDVTLGFSTARGLYFAGSGGLEAAVSLHQELFGGALRLDSAYVSLRAEETSLRAFAAATASVALGPLIANIEQVGLTATFTPPAEGVVGAGSVHLGFKPPKGIGIAIDAGAVVGGGFIAFDETKGRYSGVLQLSVAGISIKAIGILDTMLPSGAPGYSFLLVIFGEFQPMQLGFGFTLNGVGGLAGIHRSMMTAALQSGIRSHSVDHVLFPEDPIRDAPQIVSDLGTIFPPTQGRYVFGPMALIGFGTPTFIEVELGILLEVPEPIRLVLLGQINATLPAKEAAIVELHLDVLGVLDFGKKTLAIDAVLHDSRLVAFDLYGDMALRLSWGDQPAFALSIGGFNPRAKVPTGFPALRRLTLALSAGDNPRFTLQTYLALTSNSLQFGARADLYAEALGFSLSGWLGFDVLVIFSPFSFIADLTAGFAIKRGTWLIASVTLDASFSGPTPWHLWGEASFYFIFRITVGVDITIGQERKAELPPADPGPALQAALSDARNWSAALPPTAFRVVSVAQRNGAGTGPLVDPVGGATVRQRVVPLNRTITKFGEAKPLGPGRYSLTGVAVGSAAADVPDTVQEFFAPAQFEQLSDAERLSRPDFEKMDAGFTVESDAVTVGSAVGNSVVFNTIIVDAPDPPNVKREYAVSAELQAAALGTSASALAPMTSTGEQKYAPAPDADPLVALADEGYVIVRTDSLQEEPGVLEAPTTKGAAAQALAAHIDENPRKKGRLQVVPVHELASV